MAVQNTSLAALLLRIENSLPNLSKSERKVAEYIRGNPRGIIDLSVAALADACGVSDPTVVRAYKKLGFSGYEDLKLTLAQATAQLGMFQGMVMPVLMAPGIFTGALAMVGAPAMARVEGAEQVLFSLGFTDFRVRVFHDAARVQLKPAQMQQALSRRSEILENMKPYFEIVLLDLNGR